MNDSNPRLQCEGCGKWRRLFDRFGNQLMFPFNTGEDLPFKTDEVYQNLCVWCHKDKFGIKLPPLKEGSNS